jgi:hypothetical protein
MTPIERFESQIANYFGAPYAVAVDCCTHAIELCIRLLLEDDIEYEYSCPKHTYLSIPMTFEKLNLAWHFEDEEWAGYYTIGNTNIIDAAVLWEQGGYVPGNLMCLSFQLRKHLSIGKGGMILCDDKKDADILRQTRYDGRPAIEGLWHEFEIERLGYHYQMTYENAELGLMKFNDVVYKNPREWSWKDYPDLSTYKIFRRGANGK